MSAAYYDTSENFHPFACDGPGKCRHCDRRKTWVGSAKRPTPNRVEDWQVDHDPAVCALCDPEYDMQPNSHWRGVS